jgi:hypothetical protein
MVCQFWKMADAGEAFGRTVVSHKQHNKQLEKYK